MYWVPSPCLVPTERGAASGVVHRELAVLATEHAERSRGRSRDRCAALSDRAVVPVIASEESRGTVAAARQVHGRRGELEGGTFVAPRRSVVAAAAGCMHKAARKQLQPPPESDARSG